MPDMAQSSTWPTRSERRVRRSVTVLAATLLGAALLLVPATASAAAPAQGLDMFSRATVANAWNTIAAPALATPAGWTGGSLSTCTAGTVTAAAQAATLAMVNLYRTFDGLRPVTFDPALSAHAQQAALMMAAQKGLSHDPPSTWACYSAEGAGAAGRSNLALGWLTGPASIGGYMTDPAADNAAAGHRRWILNPDQQTMGSGYAGTADALWVTAPGLTDPLAPTWTTWPSPGYFPAQAEPNGRWSLSEKGADFTHASVTVSGPTGTALAVTVDPVHNGYGDNTLVWELDPTSLAGTADRTFNVTVGGVVLANQTVVTHTYAVRLFDAASTGVQQAVAPPNTAVAGSSETLPPVVTYPAATSRTVDLTAGPVKVTASAHITDATGTQTPTLSLRSQDTGQTIGSGPMTLAAGTIQDGTWTRSITLPQGTTTGGWSWHFDRLADTLGNVVTPADLSGKLLVTQLTAPAVPKAPTAVTATPADGTATVTWVAPADTDRLPLTGYTLTTNPAPGSGSGPGSGYPSGYASTRVAGTATTATVTGLTNGTLYTFTVTATNTEGGGPASARTASITPSLTPRAGTFVAVSPTRLLDTRIGLGAPAARVLGNSAVTLKIAGHGGVPAAGVGAVVLNVTTVNPTGTGFVTVYPSDKALPDASNLNFVAGDVVPNLVTVPVAADGTVTLFVSAGAGSIDLLADVAGYYLAGAPSQPGAFAPLSPTRLLDTRGGIGAPTARVAGNGTVTVNVAGVGGVPATGVGAVVLNVTAVNPADAGFVTVYPTGAGRPNASNLNFVAGDVVANLVTVPVAADGTVTLFASSGAGSLDLLADVAGYYLASIASLPGTFAPLTPTRLLDTRSGLGAPEARVAGNGNVALKVTGSGGIPTTGVRAVVLNVTAVNPAGSGYLTVYQSGAAFPDASNLNFAAGAVVPNLVTVPVAADGTVTLFACASTGSIDLLADVAGYYLS